MTKLKVDLTMENGTGHEATFNIKRGGDEIVFHFFDGTVMKIIPPPPKTYTFAEAYAMMKQGKWMKASLFGRKYRYHCGRWQAYQGREHLESVDFTPVEIEDQWIEAN